MNDTLHTDQTAVEAKLKKFIFGEAPDPLLERLTRFIATVLRAPVVFMTLVDKERQHFHNGFCERGPLMDAVGTPIAQSFCRHVVTTGEPLVVPDARQHVITAHNTIIDEKSVLAYLGVPLIHSAGAKIGTVCVIDYTPHGWTDSDLLVLRAAAAHIMTELELRVKAAELDSMLCEMRQVERERRSALKHTVHDLRTPLTSLQLCLSTLQLLGPLNPEQTEYVSICSRATGSLRTIVESILDLELLAQHGPAAMNYQATMPGGVANKAIDQVVGLASDKRIRLSLQVDRSLGPVRMDAEKIGRVLVNLLGNAVKFTPREGTITVTAYAEPGAAPQLVFSVADTGIGMADDELRLALAEGARCNPGGSTGPSSGLGLLFCQKIVAAHRGQISAKSATGQGTTFYVRLPMNE